MIDLMGIINIVGEYDGLKGLTNYRSVASVPVAGRYRAIDFTLSNMVNSGIRNIGIFPDSKYRSLADHLRSRKEWDLDRKKDGLFILPSSNNLNLPNILKGDLENFYINIDYLHRSSQKYVVISFSNMICKLDYNKVLEYHIDKGSDITIIYEKKEEDIDIEPNRVVLELNSKNKVVDMEVNPIKKDEGYNSMEIYLMKKELFIDLINESISRGEYDFTNGVIKNLNKLKVYGYSFEGYTKKINTIKNYYQFHKDLLNPLVWEELFFKEGVILTKVKDEPPTKYNKNSKVRNSLIANGCIIEGEVRNSVLFRGVRVKEGSVVSNSIIMQKCIIEEKAHLDYVILDKDSKISKGKHLIGEHNYTIVIERKSKV